MRMLPSVLAAVYLTTAALPANTTPALVGTWRSAPEETPLASEFDISVWGQNAKSVRTVEMAVRQGGNATLTVTRRVVDAKGRTVTGSTAVERATMMLDASRSTPDQGTGRAPIEVTIAHAERQYPDDPGSTWPLEGLKVGLTRLADDPRALEVRFDPPDGRGAFWETLRRR